MPTTSGLLKSQIDELTRRMRKREKLLGKDRYFGDLEYMKMFDERIHLREQLRKLNARKLKGI
jgi:hypothetical protein